MGFIITKKVDCSWLTTCHRQCRRSEFRSGWLKREISAVRCALYSEKCKLVVGLVAAQAGGRELHSRGIVLHGGCCWSLPAPQLAQARIWFLVSISDCLLLVVLPPGGRGASRCSAAVSLVHTCWCWSVECGEARGCTRVVV